MDPLGVEPLGVDPPEEDLTCMLILLWILDSLPIVSGPATLASTDRTKPPPVVLEQRQQGTTPSPTEARIRIMEAPEAPPSPASEPDPPYPPVRPDDVPVADMPRRAS